MVVAYWVEGFWVIRMFIESNGPARPDLNGDLLIRKHVASDLAHTVAFPQTPQFLPALCAE